MRRKCCNFWGSARDQQKMHDWSFYHTHCKWKLKRVTGIDEVKSQRMAKNASGLRKPCPMWERHVVQLAFEKIPPMILSSYQYVQKVQLPLQSLKITWWWWHPLLPKVNSVNSSDIRAVMELKVSNFWCKYKEQIKTLRSFTATINLVILFFQTTPSFQGGQAQMIIRSVSMEGNH